ncbi:hypothetical protein [Crassaminicella indica]|uniref:Uncharacterized protein n=1 Tax=Crassaminicella indica TaxID=2855394 RepID=A0ABX8RDY5_9CLOT|nr:hypothetical protein [Crassaminicella indica]QXM07290.1 hypothetical protein KVH43_06285 [Crassaminicella indica]
MNKREKRMIWIILILLAVLTCKSLIFDQVKVKGEALLFKQFVEKTVQKEERYNNFLEKIGIASKKIVDIKKVHNDGSSRILVYFGEKAKEIKISGAYRATVRGYIFHVIPYKEFKLESKWEEEK